MVTIILLVISLIEDRQKTRQALLLQNGAGYMQIAAFISSLMMVGAVTLPLEIKHFGKKASVLRNVLAFLFAFVVALVIGKVMGEL